MQVGFAGIGRCGSFSTAPHKVEQPYAQRRQARDNNPRESLAFNSVRSHPS